MFVIIKLLLPLCGVNIQIVNIQGAVSIPLSQSPRGNNSLHVDNSGCSPHEGNNRLMFDLNEIY